MRDRALDDLASALADVVRSIESALQAAQLRVDAVRERIKQRYPNASDEEIVADQIYGDELDRVSRLKAALSSLRDEFVHVRAATLSDEESS